MNVMEQFRQKKRTEETVNSFMEYRGIRNPNEPHLACILLLDTSISMNTETGSGTRITLLNQAIARMKQELMMDELARKRVDIMVIEYNDSAHVVCDWVDLDHFNPPVLTAGGMTAMGEGINLALDKGKERRRFYKTMGTPAYATYIYNITDGEPNDDMSVAEQRVQEEEAKGLKCKAKLFNCAVPGADEQYLARLSMRSVRIEETAFDQLFNWIAESMAVVSDSNPDEHVSLPAAPAGVTPIPANW